MADYFREEQPQAQIKINCIVTASDFSCHEVFERCLLRLKRRAAPPPQYPVYGYGSKKELPAALCPQPFPEGLAHITQFLYCQYNTAVRVWQEIVEPDKSGRRVATKSQSKTLFHACRFHYIGCGRKSQAVETEISQPAEEGLRLPVCPVGSTADAFRILLIPPHLSVIAHASLSENGV